MPGVLRIIALSLILTMLLGSPVIVAQEKLILAVTLIRHGDRTPISDIPASPHEWTLGLGELTPLGIHQVYLLGQRLRMRYIEELHLLPPEYEYNSIYACATDFNRTIMSAQALLCGLYPPGTGPLIEDGRPALPSGFQPIPVRTLAEDHLLLQKEKKQRYKELVSAHVYTSPEWKKVTSSCAGKLDRWSAILGVRIDSLSNLIPPGDNLNVRLLKGAPLPEGLVEEEAREIVKLSRWALAQEYRPREIASFMAGDFLNEVVTHMERSIEGKGRHMFLLYSAHDSNILPVMAALGSPLDATPPYASNICFELYRDKDEHYVRVRYNEEDMTMPFAGAAKRCAFEVFKRAVTEEMR